MAENAREAMLYSRLENAGQEGAVRCRLCSHGCIIPDGKSGKCLVRKNIGGKLTCLNWGKQTGLALDPIEKKPFFHFKPCSKVLSFGTPGCNFRCLNCQNWDLSQGVKEAGENILDRLPTTPPKKIVDEALRAGADGIAYTYSEPTIFFEYAYDIIQECRVRKANLFNVFVSNGYFSKEAFELIEKEKLLDAIRIDLKFIEDEKYWEICGGRLKPVLDSIKRVWDAGVPLEIINLVIPGKNDDEGSILELCEFVKSVSPDIPLHFSKFYPYYKMNEVEPTSEKTLVRAKKIAREVGVKYAYIGNTYLPDVENTYCPKCNLLLVERDGFMIKKNVFDKKKEAICPKCGEKISMVL